MKKLKALIYMTCAVAVFSALFVCADVKAELLCKDCKNIEIINKDGLYVIHIPEARKSKIEPYVSDGLEYNKEIFKKTKSELVINAGYFDPKSKETSSYVVVDKKVVLDPTRSKSLMTNKALEPFMPQILNRTEFRVLDCKGRARYEISAHSAKPPFKCEILHSIQAGPLVYPDLRMEEEYFVAQKDEKVVRDSITALQKCARTAIGLKGNDIYIIIATVENKLTLPELAEICKDLKLDKAMNFDGGGSTSLNFAGTNSKEFKNLEITSDKDRNARKLKSFLVVY